MPYKPTLIFSPGAWHTGTSFHKTISLLSPLGYTCIPLNLPSIGSDLRGESPPQSWDADVAHIRASILRELDEAETDVVLVVHSYSGTVGSEACKDLDVETRRARGKDTAVVGLVYLSAIAFEVGMWVWMGTDGKPADPRRTVVDGDLCCATDTVSWFYNECSAEDQASLPTQLQSHAWKAFLSKQTYAAWKDIPSWYLYCENDHALTLEVQKMFTGWPGARWKTETCDADHSPMVSRPEVVARLIKRAAGEVL